MNKFFWLVALVPLVALSSGCSSSNSCGENHPACTGPTNYIDINSNGVRVKNLTLSGLACEGAHIVSTVAFGQGYDFNEVFEPDAIGYQIGPIAGECDVQIELENGATLEKSFTFTYVGGCCQSYVTSGNPWELNAENVDAG